MMQTNVQSGGRHLADEVREVNLAEATEQTWAQLSGTATRYSARTVVKRPGLRVVTIALEDGAEIPAHSTDADITVHVLSGKIVLGVVDEERVLGPGQLVAVGARLRHDLLALEDSVVLLTLSGPR